MEWGCHYQASDLKGGRGEYYLFFRTESLTANCSIPTVLRGMFTNGWKGCLLSHFVPRASLIQKKKTMICKPTV